MKAPKAKLYSQYGYICVWYQNNRIQSAFFCSIASFSMDRVLAGKNPRVNALKTVWGKTARGVSAGAYRNGADFGAGGGFLVEDVLQLEDQIAVEKKRNDENR